LAALTAVVALAAAIGLFVVRRADEPVRSKGPGSAIAAAARAGAFDTVRELIANGADVNAPANDGATALLWAVYYDEIDAARGLVAAGARVDIANRYGVTPLLQASRTGETAIIQVLLESGADPNLAPATGQTALMAAAHSGHADAVRLLLKHGATVDARDALQQQTALMWAAAEGHLDVVDVLLDAGADPNVQARVSALTLRGNADFPSGGFSALMWAARNGHEAVLLRLLDRGATPTLTNGDGVTATIIAIVNDRFDIAATLVERGADPNDGSLYHAVDMHDATTDMYALDGTRLRADHPNTRTALQLIALLLDRGADPDKPVIGQLHSTSLCCGPFITASAFYRASIAADVAALELMMAHGADMEWSPTRLERQGVDGSFGTNASANDYAGWPPIRVAMRGGRGAPLANGPGVQQREGPPPYRERGNRRPIDALKLLLKAGADPNAVGPDGSSGLHEAVQEGRADMIRVLAGAGARLDHRNRDGLTALQLAERMEQEPGTTDTPAVDGRPAAPSARVRAEVVAVLRQLTDRESAGVSSAPGGGGGRRSLRMFE
jgi:ankyrin repeat protein